MDTGNDYRILVAEDALKRLQEIFRSRKFRFPFKYNEYQPLIDKCHKFLQTIRYCYLEIEDILKMNELTELQATSQKIEEIITDQIKKVNYQAKEPKEKITLLELDYIFVILKGLARRLQDPSDPAFALDTFAVQISNVSKHPKSKNLFICRTTDGKKIWQIVTNISTIKKDQVLPAVHLPPVLFDNVMSEAMFVSDESMSNKPGDAIKPSGSLLNNINGQVFTLLKKK
ncbi:MAG: hypothetical protein ACFFDI_17460 [Promethearchaeota archaeon]